VDEDQGIRDQIEETRGRVGDTVEAIGQKLNVKERARGKVRGAKDTVVGGKDAVVAALRTGTGQATGAVKTGARRTTALGEQNPLVLGLGAVAVGFLVGAAIPSTELERERMGPAAEQVTEKLKETGREAVDRGKEVVQESAQAAVETAREKGKEQAQELASSARESMPGASSQSA
jgi:hypothetical protein